MDWQDEFRRYLSECYGIEKVDGLVEWIEELIEKKETEHLELYLQNVDSYERG